MCICDMPNMVKVAIEKVKYHFDILYTYSVPEHLKHVALVGTRVIVPFGIGNSYRQGIVVESCIDDNLGDGGITKQQKIKSIYAVVDGGGLPDANFIELAKFMKRRYYSTLFDAFKLMIPPMGKINIRPVLQLDSSKYKDLCECLSGQENLFVEKLTKGKKVVDIKALKNLQNQYGKTINHLKNLGVLWIDYELSKNLREKAMLPLTVNEEFDFKVKFTAKQGCVLEFMKNSPIASVKEICYFTGVSKAVVDTLVKKGALKHTEKPEQSVPAVIDNSNNEFNFSKIDLTLQQQEVCSALINQCNSGEYSVSLLYGVTGSGKTMVMMSLIDYVLKKGKSVIFMVPEIALTAQLILLFKSRYGENVAVLHSALAKKDRENEWRRIKNSDAKVIIGTRTAVFAPNKNLGLIVMDEEHEHTYKSDSSPRFHARDIAKYRCFQNRCMLLLASATPSLESYFFAKKGIYSFHKMNKRYGHARLPEVEIIDMNPELLQGNPTPFSKRLLSVISEELSQKRQVILLINRRGYNTFVRCRECKQVITCPNCNIALNYHKDNNRLMCHYCGHSVNCSNECPQCHGRNIEYNGIGTQRAEFQLKELIPNAKIIRVDSDSITAQNSHKKIFQMFSQQKYDIMIGTQMISKGLNFSNVSLVGVLSADQALYNDDFRSYERAFALLTQAVGRSGRGGIAGKALIQTYTPENSVISLAAKQDYDSFYGQEIEIRKQMLYPPYTDICMVIFVGESELTTLECCTAFFESIKSVASSEFSDIPLRIFHPSPASINKMCGTYRFKIVMKCKNSARFQEMMDKLIMTQEKHINDKGVNMVVDMNPEFIL